MSDELDEFLRQAAERRKQRQQQKSARAPLDRPLAGQPAPAPPPVLPEAPRRPVSTLQPSDIEDAYERKSKPAPPPPAARRPAPPRKEEEEPIRLPSQFDRPKSTGKGGGKSNGPRDSNRPTSSRNLQSSPGAGISPRLEPGPEVEAVVVEPNAWNHTALIEQLRNPQSIKAAIVLNEILKRPWE